MLGTKPWESHLDTDGASSWYCHEFSRNPKKTKRRWVGEVFLGFCSSWSRMEQTRDSIKTWFRWVFISLCFPAMESIYGLSRCVPITPLSPGLPCQDALHPQAIRWNKSSLLRVLLQATCHGVGTRYTLTEARTRVPLSQSQRTFSAVSKSSVDSASAHRLGIGSNLIVTGSSHCCESRHT